MVEGKIGKGGGAIQLQFLIEKRKKKKKSCCGPRNYRMLYVKLNASIFSSLCKIGSCLQQVMLYLQIYHRSDFFYFE